MVINRIERDHRYIVMEYAMFHKWHIAELASLLEPTVGILLNVSTEHWESMVFKIFGISSCQRKPSLSGHGTHSLSTT